VVGLHNWIRLYLEEKKGNIDYRGFIKPKRKPRGTLKQYSVWVYIFVTPPLLLCVIGAPSLPSSDQQLITLQFSWGGSLKPCSSSFIGTSPEFEMALYTLCFFMGEQENIVQVGPYKVSRGNSNNMWASDVAQLT
jgi:poly(U)-specific endoribonuclease